MTCRGCCPDWEFSHNTALTEESQLQQNGATPSSNNRKLVDLVQKFAMMANCHDGKLANCHDGKFATSTIGSLTCTALENVGYVFFLFFFC